MSDNLPRGLYWSVADDGDVSAYCDECAQYLETIGGEWTDEGMKFVDGKVICLVCFERVKLMNDLGGSA
jgi:hypothetical protein